MAKLADFELLENQNIARGTYRMSLLGDCSAITKPGQFVNVALEGKFLRRPLSACHVSGDRFTLIYKVVGGGTGLMSELQPGTPLNILTGLGNGFNTEVGAKNPLLVGGGAGAAPLYWLAEMLLKEGRSVTAVLGFNSSDEVFMADEFERLGAHVIISTADGSAGVRGFVTDAMRTLLNEDDCSDTCGPDYIYACGPEPMLKAVYDTCALDGQYSFEERMACGFGACMCCTCKTKLGPKRICKDGPVLMREEIKW